MVFALALACALDAAADVIERYPQFPPYSICRAAEQQASRDWQILNAQVAWARWWNHHTHGQPIEEARDRAYRLWDCWYWAAQLKGNPAEAWCIPNAEGSLRGAIGDENFKLGRIPLPISWR